MTGCGSNQRTINLQLLNHKQSSNRLIFLFQKNKIMLAFYLAAPEVENDRKSLNTIAGM
jgi:hypothetical protein